MIAVAYTGAFQDFSGMGEAARQIVTALDVAGVTVVGKLERYAPSSDMDFGAVGKTAMRCCANPDKYRIQILHVTPDEFPRLKEDGVYTVAHFFWETDRLPAVFIRGMESVDEIWAGSQATVDAIRRSGIDKPVHIFPQPTATDVPDVVPYDSSQTEGFNGWLFYNIFEWTERKNPALLINAYLSEFRDGENVGLLLKTYFQSFAPTNIPNMRDRITAIMRTHRGVNLPPIFLELNPLSRNGIHSVHARSDCYVSPHRGEGWGIPAVEAMAHGNPVIITGYGGVAEYVTDGTDGMLLPYIMGPVTGMTHATRYYSADQNWADVAEADLRDKLRYAYDNQEVMTKIGGSGQQLVRDRFNYMTVGDMMKARLETIGASLT